MIADLPHEVCSIDHWRCSALPVVRSNCPTVLLRLSAFSPLMLWGSWSLPLESFNSPFITRCDIALGPPQQRRDAKSLHLNG